MAARGYNLTTMGNFMRKLRLACFIGSLIEIAFVGVLTALYFVNIPSGIREYLTTGFWVITLCSIMLIDLLFCAIILRLAASSRQKSDLKAADLIGSDVQEAYNFGQIGMAVTDENDIVIWTNNLFKERNIEILDKNILDWQNILGDLKDGNPDRTANLEIGTHSYEAKYLSEAHLFIFKDTTELVNLTAYERAHAMVIGMVVIDNYADIVGNTEDDNNDIVSRVRAEIMNYFNDYHVVLRRFRNDSYLAITNYEALCKMEEDGFDILNKTRALAGPNDVRPTLSIGFAHDFPEPDKINAMASSAIDIAMSRGGDQAVVSQYNKELKFFGGKTEAVESQSKVKIRNSADGFIGLVKGAKNVYVMGHAVADMDAIGACLGVMAIAEYCHVPCKLVYDPKNTEKKTRLAFQRAFGKIELEKMTISPKEAYDSIKSSTLLVVVDVSVPERTHAPKLLDKSNKTVVIDHHRRASSFIAPTVLEYIEPSASSASEILAEMIRYATANPRIEIKPAYATIMLSGMFLDTNFFKSKTVGISTFDAAEVLKTYGADNGLADDYLKDEYEEYSLTTKIVSTMKTPYYGVVYCLADDHDVIDRAAISKVANQLMQLKGINASFVIGRTEQDTISISCRSDSTINVQLLAEKMNGGGHFSMSAASFKNQTVSGVENILLATLATYLNEAKSFAPKQED